MSYWSELPMDLLDVIGSRILAPNVIDYIRFRAVCKLWRSVLPEKPTHLPPIFPIIVISFNKTTKSRPSLLYNLANNNHYQLDNWYRCNRYYCGSGHGWLVSVDTMGNVSLYNPITRVLSSDCIVMANIKCGSIEKLAFCKVKNDNKSAKKNKKEDKKWMILDIPMSVYTDITYCNGLLYALERQNSDHLLVCGVGRSPGAKFITSLPDSCKCRSFDIYLIESFGEILLLKLAFNSIYFLEPTEIELFKLNSSSQKWSTLEDLEVEEAKDDFHQLWRFDYVVLFAAHRRSCLRMLAEDAVLAKDEKAGKSSEKYCRYPTKDWMRSKNLKPSSKFVVYASSEESSSSDRTMDDSVVIGTVTADNPSVSYGWGVWLHAGGETGQFFKYPENVDIAKKFLQYKKSLDREWGDYVMNIGLWFRTQVRPSGNVEHYQVPSLDRWKRSMDIGDDIDIVYYNATRSEVIEEEFLCYLNQVTYGLSIPLTFFQKGVMNAMLSCPGQLNGNIFEMMRVYEVLNQKWRDSCITRQFVPDDVL
ncbi:hypothetical protein GIB67_006980 [Kingdonia uniflora]|uniref:KIB1-4 beta-propeller domain-containing protein n=1 Tax=Kingdonia uniflora TaxID=39325 RepID=A0A7J7NZ62_9MAGN|nr:hypothetical protein GIB67_006980 [Kingdonia uniflora]